MRALKHAVISILMITSFMYFSQEQQLEHTEVIESSCSGYTVVDAYRVVDCKGDTILYDWQIKLNHYD